MENVVDVPYTKMFAMSIKLIDRLSDSNAEPMWGSLSKEDRLARIQKHYAAWAAWKDHCWKSVDAYERAREGGTTVGVQCSCGSCNEHDSAAFWRNAFEAAQGCLDGLASLREQVSAA